MIESGAMFPIERSDYYRFWQRERAEIDKVKWVISEKNGADCGWSYAMWIWTMQYRAGWISALRASGEKTY